MIRWALAFVASAALAASVLVAAASAPAAPPAGEAVPLRDPSTVGAVELELILTKIREGDLYALNKDLPAARVAWAEARRRGLGLWPIHEGLGDSFARAKQFDAALAEYRLSAERVPEKFAGIRIGIGAKRAATLASAGRPLEAIQAYLDLNEPGAFGAKIFTLAFDGDRGASIGMIRNHAEIRDPRLFKIVAALQLSLDRKADAAESLAQVALRLEPWNEAQNRKVMRDLVEAKSFDRAVEVGRAWVRSQPESVDGYEAIGDVLWEAGRPKEALTAYSSIVDLRPGDAAARRRLGEIYRRRDRPQEAMTQFEAGLRLTPNDSELRQRVVDYWVAQLDELKKNGKGEEIRSVRRRLGSMKVQEAGLFDIKVVMTWDAMSDVDLDIYEPDGTRINHNNRYSKIDGTYFMDNTKGLGPEIYTLYKAPAGTYRVGAHLHSGGRSTVKFVTILHEDTPREERREETVVLDQVGETTRYIRDIVIP